MNLKKHLKIKDMAVRNAAGIKARRERDDNARVQSVEAKCDRLVDALESMCGGEEDYEGNKIGALIDMLDTMKAIEEAHYTNELRSFTNNYKFLSFYPEDKSISQDKSISTIIFTLPESLEDDFGDMEISITTRRNVKLYGAGAPWRVLVKPFAENMDDKAFDKLVDDVLSFSEVLNMLPNDFFAWVDKNFPEQA